MKQSGELLSGQTPLSTPDYRTVRMSEVRSYGYDRTLISHKVSQSILALGALETVFCFFEPGEFYPVSCEAGCRPGLLTPVNDTAESHKKALILDSPLEKGQTTTIEFTTWYNRMVEPPAYRRHVATDKLPQLDIAIQFFGTLAIPKIIRQATWHILPDDQASESQPTLVSTKEVQPYDVPDSHGVAEVSRHERDVPPGTVVGFQWEWKSLELPQRFPFREPAHPPGEGPSHNPGMEVR